MAWYDWGNPPITSTSVAQPVTNPDTTTLLAELDSTQLGTVNFKTGQSGLFRTTWIIGGTTGLSVVLEQANSTALSATTLSIPIYTPTGQSGQYVFNLNLGPNDRLRARMASTVTASVMASIQAERLT